MQGRLQQSYRVSRELDQHARFDGTIPLSKMPRLSSLIIANETDIEVKFEFASDAYQHPSIRGSYRAQLNAQCQRCLEPMDFTVEQEFELLIDASDEEVQAFQVDSVDVVGVLRVPVGARGSAALAFAGPLTSVKEQVTGNYAVAMAARGFVTLSFDHRHFGIIP